MLQAKDFKDVSYGALKSTEKSAADTSTTTKPKEQTSSETKDPKKDEKGETQPLRRISSIDSDLEGVAEPPSPRVSIWTRENFVAIGFWIAIFVFLALIIARVILLEET